VRVEASRAEDLARACERLRGVLRTRMRLADDGAGPLVEVQPSLADTGLVAELEQRMRLPKLYAEYLRRHHCHAFGADFVLGWRGVSLCLVGAERLDDAQGSYASERWPATWVVIGLEYEGCYFIDTNTGAVGYLDHGVGLRHQEAGRDFVEFLEQVIEASSRRSEPGSLAGVAGDDRERLETRPAAAARAEDAATPGKEPAADLPVEVYAVGIGVVIAVVIVVIALLVDFLG
jgi:hypothetical protein